jgi:hypothetical protein
MSFDSWYIGQFRDTLAQPLSDSDSISEAEIEAFLRGRTVPSAMRSYYRVAGNHWLNTSHNELRRLDSLDVVGDYTIFMDENQAVVQWGIRNCDMSTDDPIVFQAQPLDSGHEWYAEEYAFSRFMIVMWQWVLTGVEPE